jgi:hypothetical protein
LALTYPWIQQELRATDRLEVGSQVAAA